MIFDEHDVTDFVVWIQTTCCVGDDQRLDTHQLHNAHRKRDLYNRSDIDLTTKRRVACRHYTVDTTVNRSLNCATEIEPTPMV